MPKTTTVKFATTVNPDETAQNEPSHLDPQCLNFQHNTVSTESLIEVMQLYFEPRREKTGFLQMR